MSRTVHLPLAEATVLPVFHARWAHAMLNGRTLPREPAATCDDCAMVPDDGVDATTGHWFNPQTKCCTYTPEIASFLVGALLEEGGAGAASVRARMATAIGVSPAGLMQGADFHVGYDPGPDTFGRDGSLLCPHYEDGRCAVWNHREATCATWYCKHARGAVHKALWNRLHQLLRAAEVHLARHCAVTLGIPAQGLALMLPLYLRGGGRSRHDVGFESDDEQARYRACWGPWAGREEDFYRACAALVAPMSWDDVRAIGGSELRAMEAVVGLALDRATSDALPARLTLGTAQVIGLTRDTVRVQGYSFLDPLDVPKALFDVLHCFDGRPVADAIRAASEAAGQTVPEGAIRALLDHEILRARG